MTTAKPPLTDQPLIFFSNAPRWRQWLEQNHADSKGVWPKFYKKHTGITSLNYAEALDEALCFGWIDGQSKTLDEQAYRQRFTPRRKRSIWSKRNREHVARLIRAGKMAPAGLLQVKAAKVDGRWQAAYDSPKNMKIPEDFLKQLAKYPKAETFFKTLNRTNTYAIAWQLATAKRPETRQRRMAKLIDMLRRNEKLH